MGVAAAATAGSAYLLGEVINKAYVDKNVRGIAHAVGGHHRDLHRSRGRRPTATP